MRRSLPPESRIPGPPKCAPCSTLDATGYSPASRQAPSPFLLNSRGSQAGLTPWHNTEGRESPLAVSSDTPAGKSRGQSRGCTPRRELRFDERDSARFTVVHSSCTLSQPSEKAVRDAESGIEERATMEDVSSSRSEANLSSCINAQSSIAQSPPLNTTLPRTVCAAGTPSSQENSQGAVRKVPGTEGRRLRRYALGQLCICTCLWQPDKADSKKPGSIAQGCHYLSSG